MSAIRRALVVTTLCLMLLVAGCSGWSSSENAIRDAGSGRTGTGVQETAVPTGSGATGGSAVTDARTTDQRRTDVPTSTTPTSGAAASTSTGSLTNQSVGPSNATTTPRPTLTQTPATTSNPIPAGAPLGSSVPASGGGGSGSSGGQVPAPSDEGAGSTTTATPSDGTGDTSTPVDSTTPDESQSTDGDERTTATVVDVVDGDTIHVRLDGTVTTVELTGVDAPNLYGAQQPDEFEGVPDSDAGKQYLYAWGWTAKRALSTTLVGETVELRSVEHVTNPPTEGAPAVDGALRAYVVYDGESINHALVADGYARATSTRHPKRDLFLSTETTAKSEKRGVWRVIDGLNVP